MTLPKQPWPVPETWSWVPTGLVGDVSLGRQRSPENHNGTHMRPYLRSANITWDGLDLNDVKCMNFNEVDFVTFRLERGDVLLNEGSGSAKEVGKAAVWEEQIPDCCIQNTLLRFRSNCTEPRYAQQFFTHAAKNGQLIEHTQGVNIFHIGKKNLEQILFALPPLLEQRRIVTKLDALTARIARARAELERVATRSGSGKELRLLDRLEESVLAKAFRGELVPQDPADEPASVLLERILAERAAVPKLKRDRRIISGG